MGKVIDLTKQRFGKLVVVERTSNAGKQPAWKCICDCGNSCIVTGTHLKQGHTKSCGCLQKERTSNAKKTHGMSNNRLHKIWDMMKTRCYNAKDNTYQYYGARGVIVCDEWKNNFKAFYDWSMMNGYADNLTLDRENVNGNYEPSNCRWVTMKTQANNKRWNRHITYNGETHNIKEWSELTGIKYTTLYERLFTYKWSVERALTTK